MKALLVGIGTHAHSWKKNLGNHPDWELVAVVDSDTEKLEHVVDWGVDEDEAYTSISEAVQFSDHKFDMAIIATPIYTHHVLVLEAMELDLNVICEKNLVSTIEQARILVKAANVNSHLSTATGTQTRWFPANWSIKKYILEHEEELGKFSSIHANYLANWGVVRRGWRAWLSDIEMEDMAPHHFDYISYLAGMDIVEVQGITTTPTFSTFKGTSTTYAILALAKPVDYENRDNWVYATYRGDWQKRGETYTRYELNFEKANVIIHQQKGNELYVEKFTDDLGKEYEREDIPITRDVEYNEDEYSDQVLILEEMTRSIKSKGKNQPSSNFKNAIKTYSVIAGIQESVKTGKRVYLPDYWKNLGL